MDINTPKLAITVPCYNEEAVLPKTIKKLYSILNFLISEKRVKSDSFILFIDDGSTDKTADILEQAHTLVPDKVKYIKFTKNFGSQSAIIAGLKEVYYKTNADCAVTIDADLQQDETKIADFLDKMQQGCDIAAGVKETRGDEAVWKKVTAKMFYKTMNLLGVNLIENHSEYRLLTRKALKLVMEYKESSIFLRGILNETGLKTAVVEFKVKPRENGKSKFTFLSLLKLGFSGLISHTTKPLNLVLAAGFIIFLCGFIGLAAVVILKFINPCGIKSLQFIELWNTFLAGIQIMCIGITGQYTGQILIETKRRPSYLIDRECL